MDGGLGTLDHILHDQKLANLHLVLLDRLADLVQRIVSLLSKFIEVFSKRPDFFEAFTLK